MRPRVEWRNAAAVPWWEYALRFVFGGTITVLTGLLAHSIGPAIAGMFLAFPAILPASLTLVKKQEGRKKAADDARGARVGALGLVGFAIVVALTATSWPAAGVLVVATLAWLAVSLVVWTCVYAWRPET